MPTVAEQLRHAREQQNLSVHQVAEITKIKTDHIRALEAGEYDAFSAPVYIRGFVRTYARALKINEHGIAADLDNELGQTVKFREPPPLTNQPRSFVDFIMLQLSKLNWRISLGVGVVVVALLVGGSVLKQCSNRTPPKDPLKNLGPGLYQPKASPGGEVLPIPTNTTKTR